MPILTFETHLDSSLARLFGYKKKHILMKQIITFLLAFGLLSSAQAQTSRDEARRVILGQPKNSGNYPTTYPNSYPSTYPNSYPNNYPNGSAQAQIDQVNRDYDAKVYSIRNNPNLSPSEKERVINQLERERRNRINRINQEYNGNNRNNRRNDNDDDDRYEKKNNGKHLGWEKGKGNPHKNGGKNKNWKDRDDD